MCCVAQMVMVCVPERTRVCVVGEKNIKYVQHHSDPRSLSKESKQSKLKAEKNNRAYLISYYLPY